MLESRRNGRSQFKCAAVMENLLVFLLYSPGGGGSFVHKNTTTLSSTCPYVNFIGIRTARRLSLQRRRRPARYGKATNNAYGNKVVQNKTVLTYMREWYGLQWFVSQKAVLCQETYSFESLSCNSWGVSSFKTCFKSMEKQNLRFFFM